jgi:hypothetical protein
MPNGFDGIELGTIGRQQAQMKAMPIVREPLPHFRSLVVRGIIVNKEDFLLAVALRQPAWKRRVTLALENLPIPIVEFWPVEIHRSAYLLRVALAGGRNQRLVSAAGPGLIEAGVLPETGFVAEEQSGFALSVFF